MVSANLIPAEDLSIRVYDPTPGGQHVGTPWEMEVTHTPSGIRVIVGPHVERSQHRARQIALDALAGALTSPAYRG